MPLSWALSSKLALLVAAQHQRVLGADYLTLSRRFNKYLQVYFYKFCLVWHRDAILQWEIAHAKKEHARDAPGSFPPELTIEIKVLACELPATLGLPLSRLSVADIARHPSLTPNDFPCLQAVAARLQDFERYFESMAQPFQWKFTRAKLNALIARMRDRWAQSQALKMAA